ncbi:excisionase family DNA binding protein [Nesterenkonia lutea]|uniref:Excisionase family DNA binding protein n=1 Tax=Nesterenkonia lutea TaxID=272919 RepID=A0ABR9JI77_9MICC|nr:excisionase family DNA binding protein [Nesterenkonia lutea]
MNDPKLIDELLKDFPDLATPQEVGDLLRVGMVTINKWIRAGHIPAIRAGLRVNRIPKKQLRDFLLNADEMKDPEADEALGKEKDSD